MRKDLFFYLFLLLQASFVVGQTYVVPDANFRTYLKSRIPAAFNVNNELILSQAKAYTGEISCSHQNISDLSGLQFFHNIRSLNCTFNNLTSLPSLDSLTKLQQVWVHDNQLSALPKISQLTKLEILNVKSNHLISLPSFPNATALKEFDCSGNKLTSIPDLTTFNKLEVIYAYNNKLAVFPAINNLNKLRIFDVQSNELTTLPDISNNTNLTVFRCDRNQLQTLPSFAHLTLLSELGFSYNQIRVFPSLPQTSLLEKLICSNNLITTLPDNFEFPLLKEVRLTNNLLTFSDLLPLVDFPGFDTVFYLNPQNKFVRDTSIEITKGALAEINAQLDFGVAGNTYTWYKNEVKIKATNTPLLVVENSDELLAGVYRCEITNSLPALSSLKIDVGSFELKVLPCITLNTLDYQLIENDCKTGALVMFEEDDISAKYLPLTVQVISSLTNEVVKTQLPGEIGHITPGVYSLRIEDTNKCGLTLNNYLKIANPTNCTNSFTPNNDGLEDTFFIETIGQAKIYDKSGKLVKTLKSPNYWDGKNNEGQVVPMGLYLILVDEKVQTEVVVIH